MLKKLLKLFSKSKPTGANRREISGDRCDRFIPKDQRKLEHLEQKKEVLEQKIEDVDEKIIRVERSARTTFARAAPLHNYLRQKSKLYYNWHLNRYANFVHIAISVLFIILAVYVVFVLGISQGQAASNIDLSGSCKQYDQSTNCADSRTVKVAVNGSISGQTGTTSSGSWSVTGVSVNGGDVLTVFIDGVDDANEANAVTKVVSTPANISGILLYERHLTVGSSTGETITNVNLSQYDYSASSDEDIFFDIDANNDLTIPASGSSTETDQELYILASNTYEPDSSDSGNVKTPNLELPSSAVFNADGNTIELTDDGTPFAKAGTFNYNTSTFKYTSGSDTNITATNYYHLDLKPSSGSASCDYTVSSAGDSSFNGSYTQNGTYNSQPAYEISSTGRWIFYAITDFGNTWAMDYSKSNFMDYIEYPYYNQSSITSAWSVGMMGSPPAPNVSACAPSGGTYTLASGTINVYGNLTNGDGTHGVTVTATTNDPTLNIDGAFNNSAAATFVASNSGTFSVGGNFTNNASATFTHSSGTITFDGGSAQAISSGGDSLNSVTISNTSADVDQSAATTIAGTLTINSSANYDLNGQNITLATLSNSGTFKLQGGETTVTITTKDTDSGTVEYTGSGTYTVFKYGNAYYNLKLNGSGSWTPDGNVTANSINIASGTFNASSRTVTLSGSGTPFTVSGIFTEGTSTVIYTGSSATNVAGSTYYNLTLNQSGTTFTATGSITASGVLTINAGTFDADDETIILSGTSTPFVNNGTFTASTSTVKYTGVGSVTVAAATYYNLETSPSGAASGGYTVSSAGDSSYNGSYTQSGTYNSQPAYTNGSRWLYYAFSEMPEMDYLWVFNTAKYDCMDYWMDVPYYNGQTLPGTWYAGMNGTTPAPTVAVAPASNSYTLASGTINVGGNFTNGDGTNAVTTTADTNDPTFNIDGAFSNSAGATFTASASGTFSVGGNFTNNATAVFTHSSGTLTLDGQGSQSLTVNGDSLYNLTVTNASSAGVTLSDALTIAGTFTDTTASSKITFNAGSTYAFANININGQSTDTRIVLTSSGTWYFNVSQISPSASYVNVTNSDASGGNNIDATTGCYDGSGNTNWTFTSGDGITISGTVYTAENKSTNIGAGKTIALSINGAAATTVETTSGGIFSFSSITVGSNNTVAVFLDGETEKASLITQATNSLTDITGLELYTSHVILSHQTAGPMTNTLLATADNVSDTDLLISVDGSNNATFTADMEVWILTGKAYTPGGNVTVAGLDILSTSTFSPEANTLTLTGSGTPFAVSGTFTEGTSTVIYTGSSATNVAGTTYYNLTLNQSGTTFTATGSITASGVLTINAGTFDADDETIILSGTSTPFVNNGTFTASTSTIRYTGAGATNITADTYYHLEIKPASGSPTYTFASGTINVGGNFINGDGTNVVTTTATTNDPTFNIDGNFTIAASSTFIASDSATFSIAGNYVNAGTFTHSSGTVIFDGAGTHTITTGGTGAASGWTVASAGDTSYNGTYTASGTMNGQTKYTNGSRWLYYNYEEMMDQYQWAMASSATDCGDLMMCTAYYQYPGSTDPSSGTWYAGGGYSGTPTITEAVGGGSPFNNITTTGSGTIQIVTDAVKIDGTLAIGSGTTFDINGQEITLVTLSNNGTFKLQGGEETDITTFDTDSGIVEYSGSGNYSSLLLGDIYAGLKINGSGSWTLDANLAVSGVLDINSGTLNASSKTITLSGSGTPFVVTGTFSGGTSTIKYTGSSATNITGTTYYNLELDHTGTTFTSLGNTTIDSVFTITNGAYDASDDTLTLAGGGTPLVNNGTFTASTSTVKYTGSGSSNVSSVTYNNLEFNNNSSGSWRPVTVTNSTGAELTNHQVKIELTSSNFDFLDSTVDGHDIRVRDSNGSTNLSYWIESWNYVGETATIWVKIPTIPTSGKTIYLEYGDGDLPAASNGSNTFDFFDDFGGDLSKWTEHASPDDIYISSGYLQLDGSTGIIGSSATYDSFSNGIIEGKVYLDTGSLTEVIFRGNYSSNTGYKSRMDNRSGQGLSHLKPPYSGHWFLNSCNPTGVAFSAGSWKDFKITVNGTSFTIATDGQTKTCSDSSYSSGEIGFINWNTYSRYDDIRVRKYASTEPTTSVGSESSITGEYTFTNNTAINSNLIITSGTVNGSTYNIEVKGNWTNSGTFSGDTSTVLLSGTSNQSITTGTGEFYNLTVTNASSSPGVTFADGLDVDNLLVATTASSTLTFTAGTTSTINDINLNGQSEITKITIRSTTTSTVNWSVAATSQTNVSYVSVSYNNASGGEEIDASDGTNYDGGNNTNWDFGTASTISISGTCKQYDQSTNCSDSETIKVVLNDSLQAQTGTTSSGSWTISGVTIPTSGDVITIFVDGVADANEANAVTKYDGSGDISGVLLYERHLTIGSDDNQTITNTNLSQYDNSVSSDEDIFFDIDTNNDLTIPASGSTTETDQELYVKASSTYQPDSGDSGNVKTPNLEIPTSATLTANANTIELTDDGTPFTKTGTFNYNTSTFKYTAGANTTITATDYYNLELEPPAVSSDGWTVSGAGSTEYDGDYTENGTANGKPQYTKGDYYLKWSTGEFYGDKWILTLYGNTAHPYYIGTGTDLPANDWTVWEGTLPVPTVSETAGDPIIYTLASGTINVGGNFTNGDGTNAVTTTADTNDPTFNIDGAFSNSAAATFTASASGTFSVGGNFTNNATGIFTHSSGTVTFDGQDTQTITTNGDTLYNIIFNNTGASGSFAIASALDINGAFTLTDGDLDLDTSDPTVNIAGNITVNGGSVTKSSSDSSVTFDGDLAYDDNVGVDFGDIKIGTSPDATNLSSDLICDSLTIASGDYLYTNGYDIDSAGDIAITGILDATDDGELDGTVINIAGSWSNSGTFTADDSTIIFDATATGKTLSGTLTGTSSFNNLTFNGSGGEWTFSNDLKATTVTVSAGRVIDNGKNVEVAGNIDISRGNNSVPALNSSGIWTMSANGNLKNSGGSDSGAIYYQDDFYNLTIATNITATRTGRVYINKLTMGDNSSIVGSSEIYFGRPSTTTDFIDMSSSASISGGLTRVFPASSTTYSQKAFTIAEDFRFNYSISTTLSMTGNMSVASLSVFGATTSVDEATANCLDMNSYNLTVTGDVSIGHAYDPYNEVFAGKIDFGSGSHDIGGNISIVSKGSFMSIGYIDFGTSSVAVGGNFDSTNITLSSSTGSSVTFDATATGKTITSDGQTLPSAVFNGSGGGWTFADTANVGGDLTVTAGTVSGTSDITVTGGDATGNGTVNLTGGTFLLDGAGNFGGNTNWTFYNLTFGDGSDTTTSTKTGTNQITVTNALTIDANQTLNAGDDTWVLSDYGTPFVVTGTFTASTSTIKYTGAGDTNITAATYYHLETKPSASGSGGWDASGAGDTDFNDNYQENGTNDDQPAYQGVTGSKWLYYCSMYGVYMLSTNKSCSPAREYEGPNATPNGAYTTVSGIAPAPTVVAGSSSYTYTLASGTINVGGNFTNGDGTHGVTTTAATNDPTLNIDGAFNNSASATFVASDSGTFSIAGNYTNNATGVFTHSNGTLTLDGSNTQTITSSGDDFYNLTITNSGSSPDVTFADSFGVDNQFKAITSDTTIRFTDGITATIVDLNLDGQDSNYITLEGSGTGGWDLVNTSQTDISYVSVSYSDASGGAEINASNGTNYDGGNNTNWDFGGVSPVNDSLTFKNPYSSNVAVADDTTEWTFEAKVTDADGPTDIDYVEVRFANSADSTQPYDSLKFRWTQSTDTFSEQADTQSAATLTSTGSDSSSSGNQWTLNFKIKFNDNFLAKDTNYAIELYSVDSGARSDLDNYTDKYQITSLAISIMLDDDTVELGNLLPGSVITATNVVTVTTNFPNGYSLLAHDGISGSDSCLLHTDTATRVADYGGTIATPTLWSGTGLGICLYSATDKEAKWGTGTTETDSNNKYAGVPEASTEIHSKAGSPTSGDTNSIGYKIVVPNTQKTGNYSGIITYTATGVLE